jgi:hypothetical protein
MQQMQQVDRLPLLDDPTTIRPAARSSAFRSLQRSPQIIQKAAAQPRKTRSRRSCWPPCSLLMCGRFHRKSADTTRFTDVPHKQKGQKLNPIDSLIRLMQNHGWLLALTLSYCPTLCRLVGLALCTRRLVRSTLATKLRAQVVSMPQCKAGCEQTRAPAAEPSRRECAEQDLGAQREAPPCTDVQCERPSSTEFGPGARRTIEMQQARSTPAPMQQRHRRARPTRLFTPNA